VRRPKHTTAKARTKAAAGRIWCRHWLNGSDGQRFIRRVMDRAVAETIGRVYGVDVSVQDGRLTRITWANGSVTECA
jgi:hypothetical protein